MPILARSHLECTARGHNKEYILSLEAYYSPSEAVRVYRVIGLYGRIGSALVEAVRYDGTSETAARVVYNEVRAEKLSKGYVERTALEASPPAELPTRGVSRGGRRPSRPRPAAPVAVPAGNTIEFFDNVPRKIMI